MFINFGEKEELYALAALQELRQAGIVADLYPDKAKIGKQMTFANNRGIPYVIMAGEDEINDNVFTLKNMQSGEQQRLSVAELVKQLQK